MVVGRVIGLIRRITSTSAWRPDGNFLTNVHNA